MAISNDTKALVAAQLTGAWAKIFAAVPGTGGLTDEQTVHRVAQTYERFVALLDGVIQHPGPPES